MARIIGIGADANAQLARVVEDGDVATLSSMLQHLPVPLRLDGYGDSLLHIAARFHHREVVEILIRHGHPVDVIGDQRATPLHVAAVMQSEAICRLLLGAGASVHSEADERLRPLHHAAAIGATRICKLLIDRGANPNAIDSRGKTALIAAVQNREVDVVRLLLQNGAQADVECYDGCTPLQMAIFREDLPVCTLLLQYGANAKRPIYFQPDSGTYPSALHYACVAGNVAVARLLARAGVSSSYVPDCCPDNYLTPFQMAVEVASLDFVQYFGEQCGERVGQLTLDGRTMEQLAEGNGKTLELLQSLRAGEAVRGALDNMAPMGERKATSGMSPL